MKSRRLWPCLAAALAMAMASGCGTVVTFFPYKSAERAADKVIDEVLASGAAQKSAANEARAAYPATPTSSAAAGTQDEKSVTPGKSKDSGGKTP